MTADKPGRPLTFAAFARGEGTKAERAQMGRVFAAAARLITSRVDAMMVARDLLVARGVPVHVDDDLATLLERAQTVPAAAATLRRIERQLADIAGAGEQERKSRESGRTGGRTSAANRPRTRAVERRAIFERHKVDGMTDAEAIEQGATDASTADHAVTLKAFRESLKSAGVVFSTAERRGRR